MKGDILFWSIKLWEIYQGRFIRVGINVVLSLLACKHTLQFSSTSYFENWLFILGTVLFFSRCANPQRLLWNVEPAKAALLPSLFFSSAACSTVSNPNPFVSTFEGKWGGERPPFQCDTKILFSREGKAVCVLNVYFVLFLRKKSK